MEANLEDFLEKDITKQVDELLGTNENEYQDELAEEMNDVSYYGRDAGEVLEELEESLDGEDNDEEDYEDEEGTDDEDNDEEEENYTSNNNNAIGRVGEKFALKYLEELFKLNDVDLKVEKPNKDNEKYDLKIYGNGEEYLIEVKFSTYKKQPTFKEIHFNNKFDYLFLIWHPNNKFYFAFISKEDLINDDYATLENTKRKDEDDLQIKRRDILDEDISNNLAKVFNLEKDLSDERKLEIYEEAENETEIEFEKLYEDVDGSTLYYKLGHITQRGRGKIAQYSIYNFLKQYDANAENHDEGDFDILYKNKRLEIKFSRLDTAGKFQFHHIKPENFDFLFLIGLDKNDVFYFALMRSKDAENYINEATSQNGGRIEPSITPSIIKFVNHLTIEDIDNYIESHSN